MRTVDRRGLLAGAIAAVTLLAFWVSCGGGGPSEPGPPPSSTSTTTSTTSTTTTSTTSTTSTTTTTTSTTTTTMASVSYANVHPIWQGQGCTGCHASGNRLVLTANASTVCGTIRNGTDRSGGQYLDNPSCSVNGSSIVRVPGTGQLPSGSNHPGGTNQCFGSGGSCRQTILAWCAAGAGC